MFDCLNDFLKEYLRWEMSLFLCSWYPLTLYGWLELPHNLCKYNKHSKQFLRTFNTEGGAINPFNCVVINSDSTKQIKYKVCCQANAQTHLVFHGMGDLFSYLFKVIISSTKGRSHAKPPIDLRC